MMLSAHFALAELTATSTGIPNDPTVEQIRALKNLVGWVLEPARALVGPLRVTSGYRSPAVNAKVGGARDSQHLMGQAADVVPVRLGLEQAFQALKTSAIPFDQLIHEPGWLHLSWAPNPRRQTLHATKTRGRMVYEIA